MIRKLEILVACHDVVTDDKGSPHLDLSHGFSKRQTLVWDDSKANLYELLSKAHLKYLSIEFELNEYLEKEIEREERK